MGRGESMSEHPLIPEGQAKTVLGHTLSWCKERYNVRVAREDGESFALTCDYVVTRLNVEIEKGVVVKAWMG
jgi:hypothetical protein